MEKDFNKPSKEELARQIARNMAIKNGEEIFSDDTDLFSVSGDDNGNSQAEQADRNVGSADLTSEGTSAAVKTAVRTEKKASEGVHKKNSAASTTKSKGRKKKKRSRAKVIGILSACIVIAAAAAVTGVYFYGMNKADGKFLANTTINGIDVSGKTEKEAYELVLQNSVIPENITLTKLDGTDLTISLDKIGYKDNIKVTVSQYFTQQNHYTWFRNLWNKTEYNFHSTFTYDKDKLYSEVKRKIVDSPGTAEPQDAYIEKTDDGFAIVKEVRGDKVDEDKLDDLFDYIIGYVDSGEYLIDLSAVDCYEDPEVTEEDLTDQLDQLNSLYDIEINYDFTYTTETLHGSEILDWITFENADPTDGYTVDEDKAMEYVEKLADKYDTYGKDRKFKSTSRGEITVEKGEGCYGWWIDQQQTCDQLVEIIEEGKSANIEPIYYKNPYSAYEYVCNPEWRTAESDIGDTYCEVDLAKQHFWYYKNGKLKYECDIVSGLPTEERNTPGGVYKLWIKEKDKVLKGSLSTGEKWETPVTFWNNISTFGVGLHDATWHPYFGGNRYKTNGSHGCINMPYDAAKYVYENIDLGTPVVMYW
ncbi:L,D-transpeptidase family protein [Hominimerdicola sp. 21CYCFAH17_S]